MKEINFKNYTELLRYFSLTHTFETFSKYQNVSDKQPIILLRHDVDYSLKLALAMAEQEAEMGIKATYFILFSSHFYNVLDEENIQLVNQIKELGHEIGLHYDLAVIEKGNPKNPFSLLRSQATILGELAKCEVNSIAMHHPASSGKDIFRDTSYINAYDDKFTKEMAYYSDSGMAWRNEFVHCFDTNTFPTKIQLLIHPIWWFGSGDTRWDILDGFTQNKIKEIEQLREAFKLRLSKHTGVIEHELRIAKQKGEVR